MKDIMKRFDTLSTNSMLTNQSTKTFVKKNRKSAKSQYRTIASTEEKAKRDYFATQIATELNDEKSLGCYRVIAEKVPQQIIFETMASVKETWKEGKIQKSRGALFVDLIKTYCDKKHIDLNFGEQKVAFV
jgi:hypothetical protein